MLMILTNLSKYFQGKDINELKVLIVGSSLNGVELFANISKYAEKTYHSFKKNFWFILSLYLKW